MPKISATNNKSLFVKFILISIFTSLIVVLLLSSIFSFLMLKLDIKLEYSYYVSLVICLSASFLTSYLSTSRFKNNYILLSLLSVIPLILYSMVNGIINHTNISFVVIKILAEIVASIISAIFRTIRKRR